MPKGNKALIAKKVDRRIAPGNKVIPSKRQLTFAYNMSGLNEDVDNDPMLKEFQGRLSNLEMKMNHSRKPFMVRICQESIERIRIELEEATQAKYTIDLGLRGYQVVLKQQDAEAELKDVDAKREHAAAP